MQKEYKWIGMSGALLTVPMIRVMPYLPRFMNDVQKCSDSRCKGSK